jgi:hypothetical protein
VKSGAGSPILRRFGASSEQPKKKTEQKTSNHIPVSRLKKNGLAQRFIFQQ